ncbi:MAG TPA: PspA/IM30 family protein [Pseudomonas sp.]|nr:PspA/IM30 family protein [Pseudomonas sp.]
MNLWIKLGSLLRGQARESMERVIDANALGILEQELHEADAALLESRRQLTVLAAQRIGLERERAVHQQRHREREAQAQAALALRDEALALEVAAQMARLESRVAEQSRHIESLAAQELKLKERMRVSASIIQDHRRELTLVRVTASAQRATALISGHQHHLHSRVGAMQESLSRIKQRQQAFDDQEQAAQVLLEEDDATCLERRLQAAGIVERNDARAVLARLRLAKPAGEAG